MCTGRRAGQGGADDFLCSPLCPSGLRPSRAVPGTDLLTEERGLEEKADDTSSLRLFTSALLLEINALNLVKYGFNFPFKTWIKQC